MVFADVTPQPDLGPPSGMTTEELDRLIDEVDRLQGLLHLAPPVASTDDEASPGSCVTHSTSSPSSCSASCPTSRSWSPTVDAFTSRGRSCMAAIAAAPCATAATRAMSTSSDDTLTDDSRPRAVAGDTRDPGSDGRCRRAIATRRGRRRCPGAMRSHGGSLDVTIRGDRARVHDPGLDEDRAAQPRGEIQRVPRAGVDLVRILAGAYSPSRRRCGRGRRRSRRVRSVRRELDQPRGQVLRHRSRERAAASWATSMNPSWPRATQIGSRRSPAS